MTFDSVRSVAIAEGDAPIVFVGRDSGLLEKYQSSDIETPIAAYEVHSKSAISAIGVVSADEVYTASVDGTIVQFTTAAEVEGKRDVRRVTVGAPLRSLVVAGDQLYAGSSNGSLYSINAASEVAELAGKHDDAVVALAFLEGTLASASQDNQVRIWDTAAGRCTFRLVGHENCVKALYFLNPTSLVTVGGDETVRLWQLPEAGEAAAPPSGGAPAGGAEAAEGGDAEGAAKPEEVAPVHVPVVFPTATVGFSGAPFAGAAAGSYLYFGTTTGQILCVDCKGLAKTVADFTARNEQTLKTEQFRVEKRRVELSNKLRVKGRRSVKTKRKELVDVEKAAATEAFQEKQRLAREMAAENEDEEAPVEEEMQMDGEGEEQPLSAEHEDELALFKEAKDKETEEAIVALKADAARRIEECTPITKLKYATTADQFHRLAFTRNFRVEGGGPVVACAVLGKNGFVAVGNKIVNVQVLPGIVVV